MEILLVPLFIATIHIHRFSETLFHGRPAAEGRWEMRNPRGL